ncbi:MAG: hypothetical protein AAF934_00580 [Bacteroidota bacterium]
MKEIARKIIAVLMTVVVLCSTMSFSVAIHYCGDTLVDRAIFKTAEGCGMETQNTSDPAACNFIKKSCCSDENRVTEGQNELKIPFNTLSFKQQLFAVSFIYTYIEVFDVPKKTDILYQGHPPPLLVRDIHVLYQTFLI